MMEEDKEKLFSFSVEVNKQNIIYKEIVRIEEALERIEKRLDRLEEMMKEEK
jgi:ubiquinone biosynthesis protein UbiJ